MMVHSCHRHITNEPLLLSTMYPVHFFLPYLFTTLCSFDCLSASASFRLLAYAIALQMLIKWAIFAIGQKMGGNISIFLGDNRVPCGNRDGAGCIRSR